MDFKCIGRELLETALHGAGQILYRLQTAQNGNVCECGQVYDQTGVMSEMHLLRCPRCKSEYRVSRADYLRQGKLLLPYLVLGAPVPHG